METSWESPANLQWWRSSSRFLPVMSFVSPQVRVSTTQLVPGEYPSSVHSVEKRYILNNTISVLLP
jgi:hypothetical protein